MRPALTTIEVLDQVFQERIAQDEKWGEQNHPDGTGPDVEWTETIRYSSDAETLREVFRGQCDERHRAGKGTFLDILLEEVAEAFAEADPVKLRVELIQVAAVAAAWVEAIDRRTASKAGA